METTRRERPTLWSWMQRAGTEHPLADDLESTDPFLGRTLDIIEVILSQVVTAAPERLGTKKSEFRNLRSEQGLLDFRTEMAMAAKLYRAEFAFAFGKSGEPSPDLHLVHNGLGIEVTAKTSDGVPYLYDEIEAALEGAPRASVHLRFSQFPVRMQASHRKALVDQILPAARVASETRKGAVVEVAFTDSRNAGSITVAADILPVPTLAFGLRITMESTEPMLTPTMQRMEEVVLSVLDSPPKARQGRSMPSLLVVDIARLGNAWLRPLSVWAGALAHLLSADSPFLAVAVTNGDLASVDLPLGVALRPALDSVERTLITSTVNTLRQTAETEIALVEYPTDQNDPADW